MDEFTSNEIALIAVQSDDAMSESSLAVVDGVVREVKKLRSVEQVLAVTEIPSMMRRLLGNRIKSHPLVSGSLLSRDGKTAAIIMQMIGEGEAAPARKATVERLREIVADACTRHPEMRIILAGPYVTRIDMYEYVDRDLVRFSVAAFALLALTLWFVFQRLRPALYAVGCGIAALCWVLGLAAILQLTVSMIVQMVVILVVVLTVANAVHLAVAGEETSHGHYFTDRGHLAAATLRRISAPCTVAIITTAVGFASIMISKITPFRVFGLLMVCGLLFGLAITLSSVPLVFPRGRRVSAPGTDRLRAGLVGIARWSLAHPLGVGAAFAAVVLVAATGLWTVRMESDFIRSFRADSEVRTSYEFIESNLTPVGTMEVIVRTVDGGDIVSPKYVRAARALTERVVADYEPIRGAMSLADLISIDGVRLPTSGIELSARMAVASRLFGEERWSRILRHFVNEDRSAMRIDLRAAEGYDVHEKLRVAKEIETKAAEVFGESCTVTVTGLYYVYAKLTESLIRDQYRSFALTVPAVFIVMALFMRSARIAAIAMVPNLLPVLVTLGAMGWLDIPLNTTSVLMLSVTLGIAVDDTVHYLWRCRREFEVCQNYNEAIVRTHATVGRACAFTTIVIAGGFSILVLSQFLPTAYFGALVGFTLLWALATDLLLLPVLIRRFEVFGREGRAGAR